MHPPRDGQEDAPVGPDRGIAALHPVEAGQVGRGRMRALLHLGQLARVSDQDDILGGGRHGQHVGQPDLSGLIHENVVEMPPQSLAREQPGGAADHVRPAEQILVVLVRSLDRAILRVGVVAQLVDDGEVRIVPLVRVEDPHQDVLHRLVTGRRHGHLPARPDQGEDGAGRDVRLAGAGRTLDGQDRSAHVHHRVDRALHRVAAVQDVRARPAPKAGCGAGQQGVGGA
jgi:hypothetical protein